MKKSSELSEEDRIKTLDYLYTAAGSIKGRDAMKLFLRDLLTESERIMLGRRIWIARLLLAGERPAHISARLKVGAATVWRVEQWLDDTLPGYERAIVGLEKVMDKRAVQREANAEPFSYAALKRKYPLHFLLFPAPKAKNRYRD